MTLDIWASFLVAIMLAALFVFVQARRRTGERSNPPVITMIFLFATLLVGFWAGAIWFGGLDPTVLGWIWSLALTLGLLVAAAMLATRPKAEAMDGAPVPEDAEPVGFSEMRWLVGWSALLLMVAVMAAFA